MKNTVLFSERLPMFNKHGQCRARSTLINTQRDRFC